MDGYLSKPVNAPEMIGLVENLAGSPVRVAEGTAPMPTSAAASSQAASVIFNPDEALARCFKSSKMLREMINCFFDDVDKQFPRMRAALDRGDLVELGRLAHRMKGTAVYLAAPAVEEAALALSGWMPRTAAPHRKLATRSTRWSMSAGCYEACWGSIRWQPALRQAISALSQLNLGIGWLADGWLAAERSDAPADIAGASLRSAASHPNS